VTQMPAPPKDLVSEADFGRLGGRFTSPQACDTIESKPAKPNQAPEETPEWLGGGPQEEETMRPAQIAVPTRQRGPGKVNPLSKRSVAEAVAEIRRAAKESTQSRRGGAAATARVPAVHQSPQDDPAAMVPVWEGDDYSHVAEGEYSATIVSVGKPEWLHRYKRWNLTVSFELDSGEQVPGYYPLGENPTRLKVSRRCKYWRLYRVATGRTEPGPMPPEALLGRMVRVTVKHSKDDSYSLVTAESEPEPEPEPESEPEPEPEPAADTDY
jgi:hypothetical protein